MSLSPTGDFDEDKTIYSVDDYVDFVDDGDWTPAFQKAFDGWRRECWPYDKLEMEDEDGNKYYRY